MLQVLGEFKQLQNCVACCNKEGLMKFLETQQRELEVGPVPTCCAACSELPWPCSCTMLL